MGVLACNRRGCENIMCDRHSLEHGYICNECFEELIKLGLNADIHDFMDSVKGELINDIDESRVFWDKEFPLPEEENYNHCLYGTGKTLLRRFKPY